MNTPEEYFDSLLSTDANCSVDVYAHKYNRTDLFRFAEAYYKSKMAEVTDEDIEKWAEKEDFGFSIASLYRKEASIKGAKAFRDGEIKHTSI